MDATTDVLVTYLVPIHYTRSTSDIMNASTNLLLGNTTQPPREEYTLDKVTEYMSTYYLWVVAIIGIPGNLASLVTIMTMSTISSSKAHVAMLAAADTVCIIAKITYSEVSKQSGQLTTPGCVIIMFVQQFLTTYVNWIVVAMTLERFVAVLFPLRVSRIYTRRNAWCILAFFAILGIACYVCFFWIFKEDSIGDLYFCTPRDRYKSFINSRFYYWLTGLVTSILPCIFVLVGNILIILTVRQAKRSHRQLTNSFDQGSRKNRDQRQITTMLILVSVVFLVLNLPNASFYVIKDSWNPEPYSFDRAQKSFVFRFVHLLMDFNHCVNFFLYFLSMSTFRRRFLSLQCFNIRTNPGSVMGRTSQTYVASGNNLEISRADLNSCQTLKMRSQVISSENNINAGTGNGNSYNNQMNLSSV